jgi:hypothetical protein
MTIQINPGAKTDEPVLTREERLAELADSRANIPDPVLGATPAAPAAPVVPVTAPKSNKDLWFVAAVVLFLVCAYILGRP